MAASLSLPPRATQEAFEASATEPFFWEEPRFFDWLLIGFLVVVAAVGIVGFCVTLAGV